MGQYYLTVNCDKRQFLDPHKFGAGLKLMEFSGQENSLPQALCILLAHANGRGGGDLHIDQDPKYKELITDRMRELVGSWAGDRIVVAGDYDDGWLFVPEDLKGKEYTKDDQKAIFGKRRNRDTNELEDHKETLYSAARNFFEDISDEVIKLVAISEAGHHPWACMDAEDMGWRKYPERGNLPDQPPKKPIAGKKVYNAYIKRHSVQ